MHVDTLSANQANLSNGGLLGAALTHRHEDSYRLPVLLWEAGPGWRMLSSGVLGGGLGPRSYVLNAQVPGDYRRTDPEAHLAEIAASAGLQGHGVGLMTAADVADAAFAADGGVEATATVGIGRPTWAAAPSELDEARLEHAGAGDAVAEQFAPGTINIIVAAPVPLSDAALVNAASTITEAKVQAVMEAGFACTGTASDALCLAVRTESDAGPTASFGGPRSQWGGRIARAVHAAVYTGAVRDAKRTTRRQGNRCRST
ncbi:adenosylcobinamide amidohydrolase [Nocardiopsis rhodophaea]|uniref:Adenosylcobinamide amidohydrolase n=1 Tax=Nocardiopsis rhodophaea TaxID=280238 RepID=A0ABN2S2A1_9ACTN